MMNSLLKTLPRAGGFLASACLLLTAQFAWGEIVPANRLIDWSYAGVRGGIPNRTTIYTTLNPGATAAQIQSAINSCPSGQVVFLNAGTYSLSSGLKINKDGVTLRGATNSAGVPATVLNFDSAASGWGLIDISKTGYPANNWNSVSSANVSSGLTRGSTSVTLASAPAGLQVGQIMVFDQVEDGNLVNVSGSVEGGAQWGRNGRFYMQLVKVTGINGNTVSFEAPIYGAYWNSSQNPQAYWFGSGYSQIVSGSGVENVKVNRNPGGGGTYNTSMGPAINCWLQNVWSTQASGGHVRTGWALFCEIRDCSFTVHDSVASATYSAYITFTSALKLENNMMYNTPCALGLIASSGCVIGYNFATNFPYTQANWLPECMMTHGGHVYFNLFEGNYVPSFWSDFTHGNASYNLYARNRVTGWEAGKTDSTRPINLQMNQDNFTVVGNVLGTVGYHNSYESGGYRDIWNLNAEAATTILRKGNWNAANNAVPVGESLGVDTIATSYYLTSKPSWFGNRPWPLIDPLNPLPSVVTNLPAGYRFLTGTTLASGPANQPPVAVATASPISGNAPLTVTFSSVGSSDPEGVALAYSWTFGDGTTSTLANPAHTYANDGSYNARLIVSDGVNSTTASNITIAVGNQPPVAAASATPTSGQPPLTVTFSSSGSSDPEGSPLSYSWDFGDGSALSTVANPSHAYTNLGSYIAHLTVSDGTKTATAPNLNITVNNLPPGLVAAYGFEAGSGNTLADLSGNGNDGAISGATWTTAGRYGKALTFNGSSSLVTINDSASLDLTAGMTLEAWVYPTAVNTGWKDIIYKDTDIYFLMGSTPTGQAPGFGGQFTAANVYAASAMPLNTWSHLAGTYDGTTMRLYVNGVQVGSRAQSGAITTSAGKLTIGGDTNSGQYWAGRIDEVRIYNRALSASEIQSDMNAPAVELNPPQGLRVVPGP